MSPTPRRLPATSCLVLCAAAAVIVPSAARPSYAQTSWGNHGANPQHTAVSGVTSRPLENIAWQTPVDLKPKYSGSGALLIHYATPLFTSANTAIVPVKIGLVDTFRVEARSGADGTLKWQFLSDYTLPALASGGWIPSYQPTLTPTGRLYLAGAGGTLFYADDVDGLGVVPTRIAFYGIANYTANPAAFNADVKVCTPITSDGQGNVYFGYRASGANPLSLQGGIARIGADGTGASVTATVATGGTGRVTLMNCAPALSNDGHVLYVGFRNSSSKGWLVALDATTLSVSARVQLKDPDSGQNANSFDDGTTSPMVAPDGRVFFGISESPAFSNNDRGWLLQFTPALVVAGPPAAFGWDDTPSLVPLGMVPSYTGTSPYLVMTKYNNYASSIGDGINKLAVLDPNDSQIEPLTGATVMKEILTIAGATPDSDHIALHPGAVKEWCINTGVVDPSTNSVLANNEDGMLYRWDLPTNTLTEVITLTAGVGEAYSPTAVGPDGTVYAINTATLFAVGANASGVAGERLAETGMALSVGRPNPFAEATSIRFSLARETRVRMEILDATGRRVAALVDQELSAGEHRASWAGTGEDGGRTRPGVYFVRLVAGPRSVTRRIVLAR